MEQSDKNFCKFTSHLFISLSLDHVVRLFSVSLNELTMMVANLWSKSHFLSPFQDYYYIIFSQHHQFFLSLLEYPHKIAIITSILKKKNSNNALIQHSSPVLPHFFASFREKKNARKCESFFFHFFSTNCSKSTQYVLSIFNVNNDFHITYSIRPLRLLCYSSVLVFCTASLPLLLQS